MEKFWEWMREKEYHTGKLKHEIGYCITDAIGDSSVMPTKQMLIGYMVEYISEKTDIEIPIIIQPEEHNGDITKGSQAVHLYNFLQTIIGKEVR